MILWTIRPAVVSGPHKHSCHYASSIPRPRGNGPQVVWRQVDHSAGYVPFLLLGLGRTVLALNKARIYDAGSSRQGHQPFPLSPFPPFHERRRTSIITPYFECYFARSLKRRFAEELTSKLRQLATQSSFSRPPSTNHCKPVICHAVRGPKRTDPRLDQDHHVRIVKLRRLHPTTRAAVSTMLDDPSSIDLPASRQAMH